MESLWVCDLGVLAYADALALQERARDARQADEIPDTLLLLEHEPVYTRGRRSTAAELPLGEAFYAARGLEIVDVDRGGRVTYHGPGQLVGYPIMRIGDIIGYLRTMERAIIAALAGEGIAAQGGGERPTGVWARGAKIASIGVHVSRRVTTHGFAVNAENDLEPFVVDRALRPGGSDDHLDRARDRPRRQPRPLPRAHGGGVRARVRAPRASRSRRSG